MPLQLTVLLIGINNQLSTQPWEKLDFLLRWMGAAMPRTKVLVLAPLPSVLGKSGMLLQQYRCAGGHGVQLVFGAALAGGHGGLLR